MAYEVRGLRFGTGRRLARTGRGALGPRDEKLDFGAYFHGGLLRRVRSARGMAAHGMLAAYVKRRLIASTPPVEMISAKITATKLLVFIKNTSI